jgi:hypothetical protein
MNSLYEQLMAAKGAPRVGGASNTTQMREAPMNLRSAMRKYAAGGGVQGMTPQPQVPPPPQISASEINNFVQANLGNPQAIADAARQYGVSADALASATGYSGQQINDYFGKAGLSPFAPQAPVYNPPPIVNPIPPQKPYYDEPIYEPIPPQPPIYEPRMEPYEPRMPQIAPDTREADELARDEESRRRQREEEAYFFKMLNERRAREEESRRDPRISPYTPRSPYSVPSSPKKNQVDEFQKLLQALGQTYK